MIKYEAHKHLQLTWSIFHYVMQYTGNVMHNSMQHTIFTTDQSHKQGLHLQLRISWPMKNSKIAKYALGISVFQSKVQLPFLLDLKKWASSAEK